METVQTARVHKDRSWQCQRASDSSHEPHWYGWCCIATTRSHGSCYLCTTAGLQGQCFESCCLSM